MRPVTPSKRKGVPAEQADEPTELAVSRVAAWDSASVSEELVAEPPVEDDVLGVKPTEHFPVPRTPKDVLATAHTPPPNAATGCSDDAYLEPGTMLADYRIESQIGEGGMGVVYAAVHPLIGKRAAVKVLKAELCRSAFNVERFVDEARVVNQIGHPNIVDVFAFGQTADGRSFFVMEWLKGESLRARVARSRLDVDEICQIIRPLARALEAAHEQGVIHRDLKPDNIFLVDVRGEAPLVKLLDFGIAKLAREEHRMERTATGAMVGTPQYIAPEQAKGYAIDHRVDTYALGGILFELLTGRPPFQADNAMEMVAKHLMEAPPRPSTFSDVPPELDDLVVRMLSKEPAGRPSIAELASVMERIAALDRTNVKLQAPPEAVAPRGSQPALAQYSSQPPWTSASSTINPQLSGAMAMAGAVSAARSAMEMTESGSRPKMGNRAFALLGLCFVIALGSAFLIVFSKGDEARRIEQAIAQPTAPVLAIEPAQPTVASLEVKPSAATREPAVEPVKPEPTKPEPAHEAVKVEPAKTTSKQPAKVSKVVKPPKPKLTRFELAITGGKGTPKILIDGKAGALVNQLAPGEHTIRISAPGAKPKSFTVDVEDGKPQTMNVMLDAEKPKFDPKNDLMAPGTLDPNK